MTLKVMLTGAQGLLGQALQKQCPHHLCLLTYDHHQLDITQPDHVMKTVKSSMPDVLINAAAYTHVDNAEIETEKAFAVNCDGVLHLAKAAAYLDIPLIHISTDYVFDGVFPHHVYKPYTEQDVPNPLNIYGASKWAGEKAIQKNYDKGIIIRTSSLFKSTRLNIEEGRDFVSWVLHQAQNKNCIPILDSWISAPTSVENLSALIWKIILIIKMHENIPCQDFYGLWHYAGNKAVSRYKWACEIIANAQEMGLISRAVSVCPAENIITRVNRPKYSVLGSNAILNKINILLKERH